MREKWGKGYKQMDLGPDGVRWVLLEVKKVNVASSKGSVELIGRMGKGRGGKEGGEKKRVVPFPSAREWADVVQSSFLLKRTSHLDRGGGLCNCRWREAD